MNNLFFTYEKFNERIKEIELFIKNSSNIKTLIELEKITDIQELKDYIQYLKAFSNSTLQYNAIIISLYGCFENYFDELLKYYIDFLLINTSNIENLPKNFSDRYMHKVGDYLSNPQRYTGIELTPPEVVEQYNSFLKSDFSSGIDKSLLITHSGNLKTEEIIRTLQELGIPQVRSKILNSEILKNYYVPQFYDDQEFVQKRSRDESNNRDSLFAPWEELVEQRNSVAHSWKEFNRLSIETILNNHIKFIRMFSDILLRILLAHLFCLIPESSYHFIQKHPINVFNNKICCFNNDHHLIYKGDMVFFKRNTEILVRKIKRIEVDHNEVVSVSQEKNIDIGIELDYPIKQEDYICHIINGSHQ